MRAISIAHRLAGNSLQRPSIETPGLKAVLLPPRWSPLAQADTQTPLSLASSLALARLSEACVSEVECALSWSSFLLLLFLL